VELPAVLSLSIIAGQARFAHAPPKNIKLLGGTYMLLYYIIFE